MSSVKTISLGDIAEFVRGISFKPDDVVPVGTPGSVACMRTKNVQQELDLSDVWAVDRSFVRRANQFLQAGDLLVSSANSWNLVGRCCWIPELPWETTFGGFVSALRPNRERVDARFLFHWFGSKRIQAVVRSYGQQTTNISNLNTERTLKLPLRLPALPEQRRIAEVLDRAESLRAKRRAALAQFDALKQGFFQEMYETPEAADWLVVPVADLAVSRDGAIRTGPFGSQLLHSEFVDDGIAVLGIDNVVENEFQWGERRFITESKFRQLHRYRVYPGDVLITIMGTCGRCVVVPEDVPTAITTKHLCSITVDREKCLPIFLQSYFLWHPAAEKYLGRSAKGAIMSGLNMGVIKEMPVSLPPISVQREFERRAEGVARVKAAQYTSLTELDALFASLQHRAFRGEL